MALKLITNEFVRKITMLRGLLLLSRAEKALRNPMSSLSPVKKSPSSALRLGIAAAKEN
jgi:hypothetical protein